MTDDIRFSRGPARRPDDTDKLPVLQWATGLTTATTPREVYAGWLIEAGKHEGLDQAMHAAGYDTVNIKHGSGNVVTHWRLDQAQLFIAADGMQSLSEMKHTPERFGIAFWWTQTESGRPQSQLKAQVFLADLLAVGYTEPVLLSVKSTLTGDILRAFGRVYDVIDAIDALRATQDKEPLHAPFYAVALPVGPGEEVQRGDKATKSIVPPVAAVPATITRDWLAEHYIKREWVATIEQAVERAVPWSVRLSATGDVPPEDVPSSFPQTPEEAAERFYARYGDVAGRDWVSVRLWLNKPFDAQPVTVEQWIDAGIAARARVEQSAA